jgi:hypothetical protein
MDFEEAPEDSKPRPAPKLEAVVKMLAKNVETTVTVNSASGETVSKDGFSFECPRVAHCSSSGSIYKWQKSFGFTSPHRHLLNCVYRGDENALVDDYCEKHAKDLGADVSSFHTPREITPSLIG